MSRPTAVSLSDLVAFLRAQLDKDEAVARTAGGPSMMWRDWYTEPWYDGTGERADVWSHGVGMTAPGSVETAQSEHMARHDPARVLRDVEAKRRIVDLYAEAIEHAEDPAAPEMAMWIGTALDVAVKHLASVYCDEPDYDPAWKPRI